MKYIPIIFCSHEKEQWMNLKNTVLTQSPDTKRLHLCETPRTGKPIEIGGRVGVAGARGRWAGATSWLGWFWGLKCSETGLW